jgi:hypothetical protein
MASYRLALKMETESSSETLVTICQTTRRHTPGTLKMWSDGISETSVVIDQTTRRHIPATYLLGHARSCRAEAASLSRSITPC